MNPIRLCVLVTLGVLLFANQMFAANGMVLADSDNQLTDSEAYDGIGSLSSDEIDLLKRFRRGDGRHDNRGRGRFFNRWMSMQRYQNLRNGAGQVAHQ